ncbi:MAG: kynureninase [Gaiellaceae bacterium]
MTSRADAERLDHADALAPFRERFVIADPHLIYADGNSLGRLPRATADRLESVTAEWGERLVSGWHAWIELPLRVGELIGRVVGARHGEVIACDSTTVNLHKLAWAALDLRPGRRAIVTDEENFPTDRYVLEGIAAQRGLELRRFRGDPIAGPTAEDVAAACSGDDVALVSLSHVAYRSGARADLEAITAAAQEAGALMLWDLSHSAGAVPVGLAAARADLAVGCTYKYLNAGPGAPAYLYVREEHQERLRSSIQGWFGQQEQFEMGPSYEPADGIERFLAGTPPILGLAAVEAGVELILEAGVDALSEKAYALTDLTVELHDERLEPLGFRLGSPRKPERRGAHVALGHDEAWRLCRALIERAAVVPDFRPPDAVRLGFAPLYSRFVDVWDAVDRLARLAESGEYRDVQAAPARVT